MTDVSDLCSAYNDVTTFISLSVYVYSMVDSISCFYFSMIGVPIGKYFSGMHC